MKMPLTRLIDIVVDGFLHTALVLLATTNVAGMLDASSTSAASVVSLDSILSNNNSQQSVVPCFLNWKDAITSSQRDSLTTETLCYLMKITETFTDGPGNIVVLTTLQQTEITAALRNCSFSLKNSPQVLQLAKNFFSMEFIATEVQVLMYKNVKYLLIFCTFDETAKLLIAGANCKLCDEYYRFNWFVPYYKMLFTGIPIPEKVITMERSDKIKTRYGLCADYSSVSLPSAQQKSYTLFSRDVWQWNPYGTVDNNGRIHLSDDHEITLHKYPMHGKEIHMPHYLRVVTIEESPYTMVHKKSAVLYDKNRRKCDIGTTCWKYQVVNNTKRLRPYCCVGFFMDLWGTLEVDLGFDSFIYIVEDQQYGDISNGTWVGMVGELVHNKADVIVASLTLNKKRHEVVDYTLPFLLGGMAMVTRINEEPLPFVNFEALKSLRLDLWIGTMSVTVVATLLIFIAAKWRKSEDGIWQDSINHFIGLFFQRDLGGKIPYYLSGAIISISVAVFTYLIMSAYTAALTANYVSYTENLVVSGFDDPKITNPTKESKYGTLANSAYSQFFRDSIDPVKQRMHKFMKDYDFTDTDHAFHQLSTGELDAIIQDYFIAYHYIAKDPECKLKYAGNAFEDGGSGFAFRKDSTLSELISDTLIRYEDFGWLDRWKEPWFINKCIGRTDTSVSSAGIEYFGGLSILLAGTVALSLCIFILEVLISRTQNNMKINVN